MLSLRVDVPVVLLVAIGAPSLCLEVLPVTSVLYNFFEVFMEWRLTPGVHRTSTRVAEEVPGPPASSAEFLVAPVLTPPTEPQARPANESC